MAPALDDVVADLCRHLQMDRPAPGEDGSFTLSAGTTQVLLRNGPDSRLLEIEAEAGSLTRYTAQELSELEGLLKANLAQCWLRDTLACNETGEGADVSRVLVKGYHRYEENDISQLADLISDVVSSAETLGSMLHGSGRPSSHAHPGHIADDPGLLIFQP